MLKLLVVEDEDIIRKGIIFTTDWPSLGFVVEGEAASGREGYDKIIELKPDVVISDIRMPEMDGIEMIEEARKVVDFETILLTSYAEFEYARRALRLNVKNYLLKPIDEDELRAAMKEVYHDILVKRRTTDVLEQANTESRERGIDLGYLMMLDKGENRYVAQALELIRSSYSEKLVIGEIAEELEVSVSFLSRRFKDVAGMTFLEVLNRYRIQKAIALLNDGTYRMGEIADRVGFAEYKYFCEVFKKYTGVSPRNFLNGLR